jgi:hypothetical protein
MQFRKIYTENKMQTEITGNILKQDVTFVVTILQQPADHVI